jgi:hypothetical protein
VTTQRSRHCYICKKCVERYDHHCPWINNCVGIKNHNCFLFLMISLTTYSIICIVICLLSIQFLLTLLGYDNISADESTSALIKDCIDSDWKYPPLLVGRDFVCNQRSFTVISVLLMIISVLFFIPIVYLLI